MTGPKRASELFVLMLQGKATTREYTDAVVREVKARRIQEIRRAQARERSG